MLRPLGPAAVVLLSCSPDPPTSYYFYLTFAGQLPHCLNRFDRNIDDGIHLFAEACFPVLKPILEAGIGSEAGLPAPSSRHRAGVPFGIRRLMKQTGSVGGYPSTKPAPCGRTRGRHIRFTPQRSVQVLGLHRFACSPRCVAYIRCLFLRAAFCLQLPPDPTSRWARLLFGQQFPLAWCVEDLHVLVSALGRARTHSKALRMISSGP
jgi:hypothetical protein